MPNEISALLEPNVIPVESIPVNQDTSLPFIQSSLISTLSNIDDLEDISPNQVLNFSGDLFALSMQDERYLEEYLQKGLELYPNEYDGTIEGLLYFCLYLIRKGTGSHSNNIQTPNIIQQIISLEGDIPPTKCNLFNFAYKSLFEIALRKYFPEMINKFRFLLISADFSLDLIKELHILTNSSVPHAQLLMVTSKNGVIGLNVIDPYHAYPDERGAILSELDRNDTRILDGIYAYLPTNINSLETTEFSPLDETNLLRLSNQSISKNDLILDLEDIYKRVEKSNFVNPFFCFQLIGFLNKHPDLINIRFLQKVIKRLTNHLSSLNLSDPINSRIKSITDLLYKEGFDSIRFLTEKNRPVETEESVKLKLELNLLQAQKLKRIEGLKVLVDFYKQIYKNDIFILDIEKAINTINL